MYRREPGPCLSDRIGWRFGREGQYRTATREPMSAQQGNAMKMLFLAAIVLAGGINCQTATAMCMPSPVNANDRSQFIGSVVHSFEEFQRAQRAADGIGVAKDGVDILTAIDVENEHLQCAADLLQGYTALAEPSAKITVDTLRRTATALIELNGESKSLIVAQLNGDTIEKPGDHAAKLANLGKRFREAWGLLPVAATTAVLSLVEFESSTTNKRGRLAITRAQRAELNADLEQRFPLLAGGHTPMSQPEAAAAIIFIGLNKKGWPMHDDPFPVTAGE